MPPKGVHNVAMCKICQHVQKENIELDITHYIPWKTICERYSLNEMNISNHSIATGLYKKRDRKSFYQYIMDHYSINKITAENALEAGKQLDRIERVIQDNPTPSNIIINWGWAKEKDAITRSDAGVNRLPATSDSGEVPPKSEEISPL